MQEEKRADPISDRGRPRPQIFFDGVLFIIEVAYCLSDFFKSVALAKEKERTRTSAVPVVAILMGNTIKEIKIMKVIR